MKKLIAISLTLTFLITFIGCSKKNMPTTNIVKPIINTLEFVKDTNGIGYFSLSGVELGMMKIEVFNKLSRDESDFTLNITEQREIYSAPFDFMDEECEVAFDFSIIEEVYRLTNITILFNGKTSDEDFENIFISVYDKAKSLVEVTESELVYSDDKKLVIKSFETANTIATIPQEWQDLINTHAEAITAEATKSMQSPLLKISIQRLEREGENASPLLRISGSGVVLLNRAIEYSNLPK